MVKYTLNSGILYIKVKKARQDTEHVSNLILNTVSSPIKGDTVKPYRVTTPGVPTVLYLDRRSTNELLYFV